jgi:hypothetical protein
LTHYIEESFMAGKNTAVFGIYQTQNDVEYAVDALRAEGYRNTDVSVLFPENKGTKDFAVEKNTKAPEGTAAGVTTGVVIGGVLGWLAGIGALAIPGIGPFIAAGPVVAALAGVGVGGAVGGIAGALIDWEFRSMRRSATKAESKKAGFCSLCIAMIAIGSRKRNRFSNARARKTSPPQEKLRPIGRRATNHYRGQADILPRVLSAFRNARGEPRDSDAEWTLY